MFDLKYSIEKRAVALARFAICARDTFLAVVRHRFGGGPAPVKMLLLSDGINAHSECQFDPVLRNLRTLRRDFGLVVTRRQVAPAKIAPSRALGRYDIIGLKFNYKTPPDIVMRAVACVEESKRPDARLVYCDGNDELTIQWPGLLRCCDVYWKKHALRDRSHYLQRFRGSTNLTDHVLPPDEGTVEVDGEAFALPREEDLRKIIVGASVGLDRKIAALQPLLKDGSSVPPFAQRETHVILRADVPDNWMGNLRRPAAEVLAGLQGRLKILLPHGRVPPQQYAEEMLTSRVCVSPFGYGEICWRDFEAVAYGCLLIKPDMGHAESRPDIFQPFKTYIPVAWDFSDLEQKLLHCLENPEECVEIVANARRVLAEALEPGWFAGAFGELLQAVKTSDPQRRALPTRQAA